MIPRRVERRRWLPAVFGTLLVAIALVSWGLSSPVGSSPDDDFHLASIWCGAGERSGVCEAGDNGSERSLPRDLMVESVCYAQQSDRSAACQGAGFGLNNDDRVSSDRGNFSGLYPPVFYFVMSAFAGPDIVASVFAIRIVASVFFVAFVSAVVALLPARRRAGLLLPLAITAVPLGAFLIASTNPSGWALLSAGTLFASLIGYFETSGWRRIALGAAALIATVLGAGARSDAAAFAVLGVICAVVLAATRTRRFLLLSILPALLALLAVTLYFTGSQSTAAVSGVNGLPPVSAESLRALILANALEVPELWVGVFGFWGLGWLDTPMPAIVWVASFGLFVAMLAAAMRHPSSRKLILVLLGGFAIWAVPMLLLVQSQAFVGEYIQPRYILPLLVLFAAVALHDAELRFSRVQISLVIGVIAMANAVALHANIRRYVTGSDVLSPNLNANVEWWWSTAVAPMTLWTVGSLAALGALILLMRPLWEATRSPAATSPSG